MFDKPKLGQLLVEAGAINPAQLSAALLEQRQFPAPLGTILVRMRYTDEETLVRTLARQLRLPVAWLRDKRVHPDVLEFVPQEVAERSRCLPLLLHVEAGGQVLYLAMEDPLDLATLDDVSFRVGIKVRPVLAAPSELSDAIARHYRELETSEALDGDPDLLIIDSREPSLPEAQPDDATAILRALARLLVEKGVITRDELVEHVGESPPRQGA